MQHRFRMDAVGCTIKRSGHSQYSLHRSLTQLDSGETPNTMRIYFDTPQKAIPEGQVAVVWDGDWCLGCGVIEQTF